MKLVHRLVPGLVAGSLLLGSAAGVFAAKSHAKSRPLGSRVFAYGLVSNLSGSGFTLSRPATAKHAAKSWQISIGGATKERALKGTSGPLANGDYAFAVGARTAAGINALRVAYSAKPFHLHRHLVRGTVWSASDTQLVVLTRAGKQVSFLINGQTRFVVNRQLAASRPALSKGEKVRVRFQLNKHLKARVALMIAVKSA